MIYIVIYKELHNKKQATQFQNKYEHLAKKLQMETKEVPMLILSYIVIYQEVKKNETNSNFDFGLQIKSKKKHK